MDCRRACERGTGNEERITRNEERCPLNKDAGGGGARASSGPLDAHSVVRLELGHWYFPSRDQISRCVTGEGGEGATATYGT